MKYSIISSTSRYELAQKVQIWCDKGWIPQGGVAFQELGGFSIKEVWVQAMIKNVE